MEKLASELEKLKVILEEINFPLLVVHPHPDGDALGAAFALREFLKSHQIKSLIYAPDRPISFLAGVFPFSKIDNKYDLKKHDAIFFIDRGDIWTKLGFDQEVKKLDRPMKIVNIDHHPKTEISGALNLLDSTASATCEIVFRLFEFFKYSFDHRIAQFLLNGIYTDTGGFRHNNTSPETMEISAQLLKKGALISKINSALSSGRSISTLKLWAIALQRAKINPRTGMVVSFITKKDIKECGASEDEISSISEILSTIAESKFSLILSEKDQNKIKASLRSEEYTGVDVSEIARLFKGGGHKLASGFEIKGNLKQVGDTWLIE